MRTSGKRVNKNLGPLDDALRAAARVARAKDVVMGK
jgi:hypothetical protein